MSVNVMYMNHLNCIFLFYNFRFPKYKQKYLQGIYDDITDRVAKNKNSGIVGIFSVADSYYRLIL